MNYSRSILFFIIIISISFAGCSEDDLVTPQEEHFEAIGIVLYTSGIQIASILRGVTSDTLKVELGQDSDHIDVKFYNEDEVIVDPPSDTEKTFAWEIDNESLVTINQHEGEEGGFEFHLEGLAQGITQVEFFIDHEGHHDFRSGKIPVEIE